jgi:hypothetical protein
MVSSLKLKQLPPRKRKNVIYDDRRVSLEFLAGFSNNNPQNNIIPPLPGWLIIRFK